MVRISNLLKMSLSSCSDTNWPRFATNKVEQGALLTAMFGWDEGEPTGDASAGEGRKWGSDACIDVSVVGCGRDMGACKKKNTNFSALFAIFDSIQLDVGHSCVALSR